MTWYAYGVQSLLSIDTSGLTFSGAGSSESTEGVANNNEIWQLGGGGSAYGPFVIFAGSMNVSDYASGAIGASQLQADLEAIYGSGNVAVSDDGYGTLTIEFVGSLAGTALTDTPWLDTSGLVSGSASLSQIVSGFEGVHEVQTIALPANLVGGTWQVNGGSALDWNASDSAVDSYLDTLLSQDVYVYSYTPGIYTVTWSAVGPQDLLDVSSIDLQVHNVATVVAKQTGGTFGLVAHLSYDSYGNIFSVVDAANFAITDTANLTTVAYAGYRYDQATETYATIHRIYDPKTGTWSVPDPIRLLAGQSNFYVYVGNDPINGTDPSGLELLNRRESVPGPTFFAIHQEGYDNDANARNDPNQSNVGWGQPTRFAKGTFTTTGGTEFTVKHDLKGSAGFNTCNTATDGPLTRYDKTLATVAGSMMLFAKSYNPGTYQATVSLNYQMKHTTGEIKFNVYDVTAVNKKLIFSTILTDDTSSLSKSGRKTVTCIFALSKDVKVPDDPKDYQPVNPLSPFGARVLYFEPTMVQPNAGGSSSYQFSFKILKVTKMLSVPVTRP